MAKIQEEEPKDRFFVLEVSSKELELILDGLYNVKGRYQNTGSTEGAEYFHLAQGMIELFGEKYYGKEAETKIQ